MPKRIFTASDSLGGGTLTAWKRRSSERSFSIDLRNSAGVVAPMHWISPRERAGFKILAASSEPSAEPAPTSVCSSSMKTMAFWLSINSFMMVLRRSSNCPRYFVPATIRERSRERMRLSARKGGTSPSAMHCASPSTIAVFPTPGSPINTGLFLVRRHRIWMTRSTSFSRPTRGSREPSPADCVRSRLNSASKEVSLGRAAAAFSPEVRASSSRSVERRRPRSIRISEPKHFSSLRMPRSKCSVPTCLWPKRSASSAAMFRMRLHSALRGTSTEVEMRSRIVIRASISFRMDSMEPCWRRKRLARALSSRIKPRSKCSVSMYGLPYWLASYLAKKITRRAFSVYRSNTLARFSPRDPARASRSFAGTQNAVFQRQDAVTTRGERQIVRHDEGRQFVHTMQPFQQLEHGPSILLVQISGRFICQQHGRPGDERPCNRHALLFPSREFPRAVIGPVFQADLREPLPRFFKRGGEFLTAQQQRHGYVFRSRKIRQQLVALPQKSHGAIPEFRQRRVIICFNGFRIEVYFTARWRV